MQWKKKCKKEGGERLYLGKKEGGEMLYLGKKEYLWIRYSRSEILK